MLVLSGTASAACPNEKAYCQGGAEANQGALRGVVPGHIQQVANSRGDLLELVAAFFLDVASEVAQMTLGSGGVNRSGTGQVACGINRRLFQLCNILPGGGKR